MSYALTPYAANLDKLLRFLQPKRVLDLDRGERATARQVAQALPSAKIFGLALAGEPLAKLMRTYHKVYYYQPNANAGLSSRDEFDIVLIQDFLEYVWKAEARVLLDYLLSKTAYLMLVTPSAEMVAQKGGEAALQMRSSWRNDDFLWHGEWIQTHSAEQSFFLFRGQLPCEHSMADVSDHLNGRIKLKSRLEGILPTIPTPQL